MVESLFAALVKLSPIIASMWLLCILSDSRYEKFVNRVQDENKRREEKLYKANDNLQNALKKNQEIIYVLTEQLKSSIDEVKDTVDSIEKKLVE